MSKYDELAADVVAKLVAAIDTADDGEWSLPWHDNVDLWAPVNAKTGVAYRGGNILNLAFTALERDYTGPPLWATYNQWTDLGANVRPGQNKANGCGATMGVRWNMTKDKTDDDGEVVRKGRLVPNVFGLFHHSQVDGWEPPEQPERPVLADGERLPDVDVWLTATGLEFRESEHAGACYVPSADYVNLPPFADFKTSAGYYGTALHESVHATGHKSRLDREQSGMGGDIDVYAREELIAELGSAFLCASLGVSNEPREDHAQYLKHWLAQISETPTILFRSAKAAGDAAQWLRDAVDSNAPAELASV